MTIRSTAVVAAMMVGLVACSSGGGPQPGPSSSQSSSVAPSASPTGAQPVPRAVRLTRGSVRLRVFGDLKAKLTLPLGPNAAYQRPPGSFSLSYLSRDGNAMIVGGTSPSGTVATSSQLTLSFVLQGKRAQAFPSSRGECTIKVSSETATRIAATFTCRHLSHGGKTISASGSFVASR